MKQKKRYQKKKCYDEIKYKKFKKTTLRIHMKLFINHYNLSTFYSEFLTVVAYSEVTF